MRVEDADIIAELHRSSGQLPAWSGFLQRLAQRCGAQAAVLILQPSAGEMRSFSNQNVVAVLDAAMLGRMRTSRVYSPEDFAAPMPFRAIRLRATQGDIWLIVQRSGADFSAAISSLLSLLAENLTLAATRFWADEAAQTVAAQMQVLAARQGLAWVMVGQNAGALTAYASGGAVDESLIQGGRLRLPAPQMRKLAVWMAGPRDRALALNLPQMQVLAVDEKGAQVGASSAVIYLQRPRDLPQISPETMAEFTGLTAAEARFAAQLLGGKTIAEAGQALHLTLETARYYSKQIYSKLGLFSQVDLVRMLASSVLRLL